MSNSVWAAACFALILAVAGCAPGAGEQAPEKHERGLDKMMAPPGGAYIGGRPGQGAGRFLGPGLSMMPVTERGRPLTKSEVANYFHFHLAEQGNGRVRVGRVAYKDKHTVAVDIVTLEGVPVARYDVDRKTGIIQRRR